MRAAKVRDLRCHFHRLPPGFVCIFLAPNRTEFNGIGREAADLYFSRARRVLAWGQPTPRAHAYSTPHKYNVRKWRNAHCKQSCDS
jgi:hypothetical protein